MVELTQITDVLSASSPVIAAAVLGAIGVWGYTKQRDADQRFDLIKLKQHEYEKYLRSFQEASRWKGVNEEKHREAENTYHNAQNYMLLHASDEVMRAVTEAHRYYVEVDVIEWKEYKRLFAEMVIAMRDDGYTPTSMSVQEMADIIPWTIGTEPQERPSKYRDS